MTAFRGVSAKRWPTLSRTTSGGAAGQYGPLLSAYSGRNDSLMCANTWRIAGPGLIRIYNPVPYAPYNSDGAVTVVTEKMRRFFWARHAEEAERVVVRY